MVFALDIGTRKIAGLLVGFDEDEKMVVHDVIIKEHEHRAMLDGQIHDVEKVAKVAAFVKRELENRNNIKLDKVAVALAGRFLKTYIGESSITSEEPIEITKDMLTRLELDAVAKATENIEPNMYCVGYSVIRYELDGMWFKKLEGLKGKDIYVKVVATYLPSHVVEAMLSVVKKVGLTITHLTLEPIAAVNITVPEDLRILNIALVDVGAGTSDIAISKDGTIIAYGMVPLAGDEITEAITKKFLLDFQTAEFVKRSLEKQEIIRVKNILDKEKELRREEVLDAISDVVDKITKKVAEEIIELNGDKPQAVMIVGGGAKVPIFATYLAKNLEMDEDVVSLKDSKNLDFIDKTGIVQGSEFITPLGIGYTALHKKGAVFESVNVNGDPIQLIGFKGNYTVWEVLVQYGMDMRKLLGRPGKSIVIEVNDETVVVKGQMPISAQVKINGLEATLRDNVRHGDSIEVGEAIDGEDAKATLYDFVKPIRLKSLETDEVLEYFPRVTLNGFSTTSNVELKDGDVIKYEKIKVKEIREFLSSDLVKIEYSVNNTYKEINAGEVKIFKGEIELSDENTVLPGEELQYALIVNYPKIRELPEMEKISIVININGEQRVLTKDGVLVWVNDQLVSPEYEIKDGDKIRTQIPENQGFIVADILRLFDIDFRRIKSYKLLKNGERTAFTEPLENGDEIIFEFEEIKEQDA
ncbi:MULTISPECIES: cell division FtsA domain-containing protein [Fervidobacterium]|uniref:Cell division protein FtsA n=1 Tax=Fervidobacterium nodosum (strain ATCC 35602 / DSM 5306 / Rt17-B1) TaxID=381764 RepID=A7HJT0_FERNB|nr:MULTISPECIES: cell division FtsA domain-containing protein [Fervidobacterium]ABS60163.1 cell division protein FtsA [Fervidobacterium nodosum Rt17-B1]KAF2961763.1 cell division protein FtsA [Fervidobacterium sp. 2310opik-2]PHJ13858.1 cell division protein FtsA [Fervidobacterium sp. SC_NGM5_G05]